MKIVTVVGARPQFVKAAALSRAVTQAHAQGKGLHEIIVHTGQHYDHNMSDVFFQQMGIPSPQYHLGIGGCSQGAMTGRMLESIEDILLKEAPQWVVVFGDTNSTLAGALAAVKLHIPVAHVEAGLRSFNRKMPEEINRIMADHCSDLLFSPCRTATEQLLKENIARQKIAQVGDIMCDVATYYAQRASMESAILARLGLPAKGYVLATIHRQENTDDAARLPEIIAGLAAIARHTPVVVPLHPRTRQAIEQQGISASCSAPGLQIIDPVGYLDMIQLETNAQVIVTDSGGIQKEAYFFQVPCLTVRDETEWTELVQHGFNRLVPADRRAIEHSYALAAQHAPSWTGALYGNGDTASLIVQELLDRQCQNA